MLPLYLKVEKGGAHTHTHKKNKRELCEKKRRKKSKIPSFSFLAFFIILFHLYYTSLYPCLLYYLLVFLLLLFCLFSMLSRHLIARNHFLLLVVLTLWIHKVTSQSAENPAFWQAPRSFNSTSALQDDPSNMRFAISQDFQSVHVGDDNRYQIRVKYRLTHTYIYIYIYQHILFVCLFVYLDI